VAFEIFSKLKIQIRIKLKTPKKNKNPLIKIQKTKLDKSFQKAFLGAFLK
jgi:hypothetical protein